MCLRAEAQSCAGLLKAVTNPAPVLTAGSATLVSDQGLGDIDRTYLGAVRDCTPFRLA